MIELNCRLCTDSSFPRQASAVSEAPTHPSHEAARFRSSKRLPWLVAPHAGGGASFLPAASTRMLAFDTCCAFPGSDVGTLARKMHPTLAPVAAWDGARKPTSSSKRC